MEIQSSLSGAYLQRVLHLKSEEKSSKDLNRKFLGTEIVSGAPVDLHSLCTDALDDVF